ncbi:hypothetical protein C8Q80DRAFT_825131 [Daedaleopsis nitida]|nr:hypothetical protein C8Q80DRAFT_825131 [Daedaleopsis nitida]
MLLLFSPLNSARSLQASAMDTRFQHFTVPHESPPPYNLVNALPPCFQRPPANAPYTPFEAMTIPALENQLEYGFALALPPSLTQPHPFSVHDIPEEDWLRFLHDVRDAAAATVGTHPGGHGAQEKHASDAVSQIIWHWNHKFWHRRQIDVSLALDTQPSVSHAFGPGYGPHPRAGIAHSPPLFDSPLGLIGEFRAARHDLRAERLSLRSEIRGGIHDILGTGRGDWIRQRHGVGLDRGLHHEQHLSTLATTRTGQPVGQWYLVLRPC